VDDQQNCQWLTKNSITRSCQLCRKLGACHTLAGCLSKIAQRNQITGAIIDGPLAFDNAISTESARTKQINSEVAGDVDILLAPDLDAGNILAKDLEYLAGATIAGIVIGAQVPIMLPSRSDPPEAHLASAVIAVLMHHNSSR